MHGSSQPCFLQGRRTGSVTHAADAAAGAPGEDQMRFKSLFVSSILIAPALLAAAPAAATQNPPIAIDPANPPIVRASQSGAPVDPMSIQGNIQVCEAARGE